MTLKDSLIVLFIVGAMSLVANVIGTPYGVIESIPGLLILIAMAITGMAMAKFLPGNIPAVAYVVTLACLLSYPGVPGSEYVNAYVKKVRFLQLCTYAGVSIGKDLDAFAKSGWRIVVISCIVFIGTYIGSAVIAQCILKALGQI